MSDDAAPAARPRKLFAFLPLAVFLALAAVFLVQLLSGRDISTVPSALIGRQAPPTELPPVDGLGLPGITAKNFAGKVTLLNVFASWCAPCRDEHPLLMQLSSDERIVIAGLNYKDKAENAKKFLGELGNPYDAVGADISGRAGIEWGVYGVPETFLIGKDGVVVYKHVGPFTPDAIAGELKPEIDKALAAPG